MCFGREEVWICVGVGVGGEDMCVLFSVAITVAYFVDSHLEEILFYLK